MSDVSVKFTQEQLNELDELDLLDLEMSEVPLLPGLINPVTGQYLCTLKLTLSDYNKKIYVGNVATGESAPAKRINAIFTFLETISLESSNNPEEPFSIPQPGDKAIVSYRGKAGFQSAANELIPVAQYLGVGKLSEVLDGFLQDPEMKLNCFVSLKSSVYKGYANSKIVELIISSEEEFATILDSVTAAD